MQPQAVALHPEATGMHMADALISPEVGCIMWAASAGTIAYSAKKVRDGAREKIAPLMGVLGAFIFAAQMINFTIPATGSSGHLGGGLLLAALLGPHAAFLTIASILTIQAFFFADGGLLALGCNIFNLGICPAFIAYPLIYTRLLGSRPTQTRITTAALLSAVAGLQLGACGVVLETAASGISALPLPTFMLLMQPIHLAIGIVEGLVSASVIAFVWKARPELIAGSQLSATAVSMRGLVIAVLGAALLTGGILSRAASELPDGLEWSISRLTGAGARIEAQGALHRALAAFQQQLAVLPDYSFRKTGPEIRAATASTAADNRGTAPVRHDSKSAAGRSASGIAGGLLTLAITAGIGFALRRRTTGA